MIKSEAIWCIAYEALAGEPPLSVHPTVKMGDFISRWERGGKCLDNSTDRSGRAMAPRIKRRVKPVQDRKTALSLPCMLSSQRTDLLKGIAISASGMVLSMASGYLLKRVCDTLPKSITPVMEGIVLKHTLSLKALLDAAKEVEDALLQGDLIEARHLLSWHLVSRDTSNLSESEVAGAAIESIAENLSDSFIAPLLMYRIGGLPAAFVYRFANTADAMLGYRTRKYEFLGKVPALIDDVLNVLPSRLTAMSIGMAGMALGVNIEKVFRDTLRESRKTSSPNAGWPMAAMASVLGCQLSKKDAYVLNDSARKPQVHDLKRARTVISLASLTGMFIVMSRSNA